MEVINVSLTGYHSLPGQGIPSIMSWLLAIVEVLNSGGRLAPQKATQKLLEEWVDMYGSETCWQGIKHFSKTFGMADALGVEALFQSCLHLPNLLKTEEGQRVLRQWFNDNSAKVDQACRLLHVLGKLVPTTMTSEFAQGETSSEQRKIWCRVSQILEKEKAQ